MQEIVYVAWGLALFFSATWTLGLIGNPRMRLVSTVAAMACWWLLIAAAAAGLFHVLHLVWLMPLMLAIARAWMQVELQQSLTTSLGSVLIKTVAVGSLAGAIAWLLS
jgi:hypothetical protein